MTEQLIGVLKVQFAAYGQTCGTCQVYDERILVSWISVVTH